MTVARVYQAPVEVLQTADPKAQVYQESIEVLQTVEPKVVVYQEAIEVLQGINAVEAQIYQMVIESLRPSFGPFVTSERPPQTFTCG